MDSDPLLPPVRPGKPWQADRSPGGPARIALAVAMLAGFALRVYRLGNQSLWYDEGFSVDLAHHDILSLARAAAVDIHPPLYFYLLKVWIRLAGTSEFSLRYLSLLFGMALVPVSYVLASRLFGRRVGLVAAVLAALSPLYVYYSQEVRMYTLMGLASQLAVYFFLRATAGRQLWFWALYVLCLTVALYSHLYSALVFGFLNLAFVAALLAVPGLAGAAHQAARRTSRAWAASQAAVVVLYAPWIGVAADKYLHYSSPGQGSGLDWIVSQTAFVFSLGHSVYALTTFPGMDDYRQELTLAIALSAPFLAVAALGAAAGLRRTPPAGLPFGSESNRGGSEGAALDSLRSQEGHVGLRGRTLFVLAYLLAPLAFVVLLSVGRRDFIARYLFAATPAYYLLVAAGLVALAGPGFRLPLLPGRAGPGKPSLLVRCSLLSVVVLAIAGAWGYSLHNYYFVDKYGRDDHRSAVAYVRQHALPGDLVVLDFAFESVYRYYAGDRFALLRLPETIPPDHQRSLATLARVTPRYPHVWLIMWGDYPVDPDRVVQHWLENNAIQIDVKVFHGPVIVYGYLVAPPILAAEPRPSAPLRADFGDQVSLLGYDAQTLEDELGRRVHLVLYWQARRKMAVNYSVFAHLINPAGQMLGLGDSQPVAGRLPTSAWEPGQVIRSELDVTPYPAAPPGDYRLLLGLYDQSTMARLPVGERDSVDLGPVRLAGRTGSTAGLDVEKADGVQLGDAFVLVGHRLARATPDELRLTLFWQARQPPGRRYVVFSHLVDASGKLVAQSDGEPGGGHYPTDRWDSGEVVRDERTIRLPAGLAGRYRLLTGLYTPGALERLPIRSWWPLGTRETAYELDEVTIAP